MLQLSNLQTDSLGIGQSSQAAFGFLDELFYGKDEQAQTGLQQQLLGLQSQLSLQQAGADAARNKTIITVALILAVVFAMVLFFR